MKLAFISDIHGNATALEAVINDMKKREIEKIFVLGDLCLRGPEPKRSLHLVKSLDAEVLKGNADEWVVRGVERGEVPEHAFQKMNEEREWTSSRLSKEDHDYLQQLPNELWVECETKKIHAFHATPTSLFEIVQPSEADEVILKKMFVKQGDIYVYAHIHRPYIRYIEGKCLINTGSVGLSFDGNLMASYALIDIDQNGFQTSIIRVAYNVNEVIRQLVEADYPNKDLIKFLEKSKI